MITRTKTTNYEMTPEVSTYLDERLAAIEKLVGDSENAVCECELAKEVQKAHGRVWRMECTLQVKGQVHRAVAQEESINAAIDKMKDEMLRLLRKEKTKQTNLLRRGGAKLKGMLRFGR